MRQALQDNAIIILNCSEQKADEIQIPAQLLQELLGQSILQAYWHCFWALLPEPEARRKLNTGLQTGSYESRISKTSTKFGKCLTWKDSLQSVEVMC